MHVLLPLVPGHLLLMSMISTKTIGAFVKIHKKTNNSLCCFKYKTGFVMSDDSIGYGIYEFLDVLLCSKTPGCLPFSDLIQLFSHRLNWWIFSSFFKIFFLLLFNVILKRTRVLFMSWLFILTTQEKDYKKPLSMLTKLA